MLHLVDQYLNSGINLKESAVYERHKLKDVPYKNDEFKLILSRNYNQFYSMYQYRLTNLRNGLYKKAMEKWGHGTKKINGLTVHRKDKILDVTGGELCWVIGTVFSDLKYKLNILDDVESGKDDTLPKPPSSYIGNETSFYSMIEDESGRAVLHGDEFFNQNILVTGAVVALLGMEVNAGIFEVLEVVNPEEIPQAKFSPSKGKIALVSGLGIDDCPVSDLKADLFKQYVSGELALNIVRESSSKIGKLIVVGNSMKQLDYDENELDFVSTNNYGSKNVSKYGTQSLAKLRDYIHDLSLTIPTVVMPGSDDPSEICLPQQPLHKSIFSTSSAFIKNGSLILTTNPAWLDIDGIKLLGTSGENIQDIIKYIPSPVMETYTSSSIMVQTLKWRNIAPTAPDTLFCYPYEKTDPFILQDELPHVYFAGNQSSFSTEKFTHETITVRVIALPAFNETGQFVILDLETLEPELVSINI